VCSQTVQSVVILSINANIDKLFVTELTKTHTHTHTHLTALCPELPGSAGTRKVKPIWILLKQETVSGSCIRWAICKSAPRSREITTPVPHHSVFYRPDALPAAQPTASKYWRQKQYIRKVILLVAVSWLVGFTFLVPAHPGSPRKRAVKQVYVS